jgi:hypothetical protein
VNAKYALGATVVLGGCSVNVTVGTGIELESGAIASASTSEAEASVSRPTSKVAASVCTTLASEEGPPSALVAASGELLHPHANPTNNASMKTRRKKVTFNSLSTR